MTKIKLVDLDELYNFHIHDFFIWNYIILQKFVQSFDILKFKIQTVQTKSVEKMTNMKVVDLDELHNFVFDIFCIWNHLLSQKSIWIPNSTKTITNMADPPRQTKKFGNYIPLSRAYCLTDAWDQPRSRSRSGNFQPRPRPYPLGRSDKRGKIPRPPCAWPSFLPPLNTAPPLASPQIRRSPSTLAPIASPQIRRSPSTLAPITSGACMPTPQLSALSEVLQIRQQQK